VKNKPWKVLSFSIATAIGMAAAVPLVHAAKTEVRQLEEVTVTARKRAENQQKVALSVSAMGKQDLQRAFSSDISDLVNISANVIIDDTSQGPGVASIYIRGIGVADVEKILIRQWARW
jgi:iron complex outermembrane receptor protein